MPNTEPPRQAKAAPRVTPRVSDNPVRECLATIRLARDQVTSHLASCKKCSPSKKPVREAMGAMAEIHQHIFLTGITPRGMMLTKMWPKRGEPVDAPGQLAPDVAKTTAMFLSQMAVDAVQFQLQIQSVVHHPKHTLGSDLVAKLETLLDPIADLWDALEKPVN